MLFPLKNLHQLPLKNVAVHIIIKLVGFLLSVLWLDLLSIASFHAQILYEETDFYIEWVVDLSLFDFILLFDIAIQYGSR